MIKLHRNQILQWFFFVFVYLIINITTTSLAQSNPLLYFYCFNPDSYATDSTYEKNLNTTLTILPTTNNGFGFYNYSTGHDIDTANSISLCRGDINPDICQSCVNNAIRSIQQRCPYKNVAIAYFQYCSFIWDNYTILSKNYNMFAGEINTTQPEVTTNVNMFYKAALKPLLDTLTIEASNGNYLKKFASGNTTAPDSATIYALVQCNPYLYKQDCIDCLHGLINLIPSNLDGKTKGSLYVPMCVFRYDRIKFFNDSHLPLVTPPPSGKKKNTILIVTMIVIGVITISSLCIWILIRWKKRNIKQKPLTPSTYIGTPESVQYDFGTVQVATNNFSADNKLGQGGFGAVYKGVFENGQEIAVKRLAMDSGQGDAQFKNEVLLVAKLQHRNLAMLLGFSIHGNERLLIYEFLPNASLDYFLFDPAKHEFLDWEKRCKIIKGIAKGLLYLHEDSRLMIVHRDMKASNVLLDSEMNAKISDFGMARLFKREETHADTSRIVGTYGYMAPEYARHGQFSVKSDVYSFGVLVLEIVAGQRSQSFQNGDRQDLLSFAWQCWSNRTWSDLIDPTLKKGSGSMSDIIRIIHIGLLCIQDNITDRPTMDSVLLMLKSLSLTLPLPMEPASFIDSKSNPGVPLLLEFSSSSGSIGKERPVVSRMNLRSSSFSVNDATISDIVPR